MAVLINAPELLKKVRKESVMKGIPICSGALAFILTLAQPAAAQDLALQVVGVWKLKSFETTVVESQKVFKPYGESPTGYYVFTKGGRFFNVIFGSDRKSPAGANPTDAERAVLFNTMLAVTATYKAEGGKIAVTLDGSSGQAATGTSAVREVDVKGNTMTFRALPYTSPLVGKAITFTAILDRVE